MTILDAQAFDDAVDATLSSYTKANGDALSPAEKAALREELGITVTLAITPK